MAIAAHPTTTVADLVAAVDFAAPPGHHGSRSLRLERTGAVLDPALSLTDSDLRQGDRLAVVDVTAETELDPGPDRSIEPAATLRILTGPLAGQRYELGPGDFTVGRASTNDLILHDPGISRHHAIVSVHRGSVVVRDLGSTNGLRIEGEPVTGSCALGSEQRLLLGQSWAVIDQLPIPLAAERGWIRFDRPLRQPTRFEGRQYTIPRPPDASPLMGLRGRRRSRSTSQAPDAAYRRVLDGVAAGLAGAQEQERQARLLEAPSIDDLMKAIRSRTRLWERLPDDPEPLLVRLGLAERPSRHVIEVEPGGDPQLRDRAEGLVRSYAAIDGVPATIDLGATGGLVLDGDLDRVRGVAASVVGQLAALNAPGQLRLVVVGDGYEVWDHLKWLPHLEVGADGLTPVGPAAWELVDARLETEPPSLPDQAGPGPNGWLLVIVDGSDIGPEQLDRLRELGPVRGVIPLVVRVGEGPDEEEDAPGPSGAGLADAVLAVDDGVGALTIAGGPVDAIDHIVLEACEVPVAEELARLLAPIRLGGLAGAVDAQPEADQPEADPADADQPETESEADRVVVEAFRLGVTPVSIDDGEDRTEPWPENTVPLPPTLAPARTDEPTEASLDDGTASDPAEPTDPADQEAADDTGNADDTGDADHTADDTADDGGHGSESDDTAEKVEAVVTQAIVGSSIQPEPLAAAAPLADEESDLLDLTELPRSGDDTRLNLGTVQLEGRSGESLLAFSLPRDRILGLVGEDRSGPAACLLTVAAASARIDLPLDQLPLVYGIATDDRLSALGGLPSLGGLAGADPGSAIGLLTELEQLMADRLLTFELAGVDDLASFRQARPEVVLRRVVVLIDGLGRLATSLETDHPGRTREVVGQLLEIGPSLGVHLVFAVEDRNEVDPLLAPKVGLWLEIDGADQPPGRFRLNQADVRLAAPGGSWEHDDVQRAVIDLRDGVDQHDLAGSSSEATAS